MTLSVNIAKLVTKPSGCSKLVSPKRGTDLYETPEHILVKAGMFDRNSAFP